MNEQEQQRRQAVIRGYRDVLLGAVLGATAMWLGGWVCVGLAVVFWTIFEAHDEWRKR